MPIFAVNLSENLFSAIRELIDRGHYQTLEGFLEVAAYNQLALERGKSPDQLLAGDHRHPNTIAPPPARTSVKKVKAAEAKKQRRAKAVQKAAIKPVTTTPAILPVDAEAVLSKWTAPAASWLPPPATGTGLPSGEHLWGQVNRLFALKLVSRGVAVAANNKPWPRYTAVADSLADEAAAVGQVLEQWDAAAGRMRDDVLATGLPRKGNSASRDRFISQYLARVNRGSEVQPGAACLYALAVCNGDTVALTAEGVKFASLPNPILDGKDQASAATLDAAEAEFLSWQIRHHAPGEYADMKAVLAAVADGKTTPSTLSQATRAAFPADWSEVVFRTHLSGLVARLADLRMLRRRWEGRNVQYELGDETQVKGFMQ